MTATDEVIDELAAVIDDLDAGRTETQGAMSHADDVRDRMAAMGWEGIAQGMQEVIDRLEDVLTGMGQAKDHTDGAAGQLRQIDARMSPTEVTEHLNTTTGKIDQARSAVTAAVDDLDDARDTVNRVLDGGDPGPLLGMIDEVEQRLTAARQRLRQAHDRVEAQVQQSAHAGN